MTTEKSEAEFLVTATEGSTARTEARASNPLFAHAHRLGMMGMQSLRYMTDIEYRDAVDAVLEITLLGALDQEGEG